MSTAFEAVKVNENVYWVGAIDWGLGNFHGYSTDRGTTYNAYLVVAKKLTLIDTVKAPFLDEMLERIASVVEARKIDYIVSNHSEMDHSGGLPRTIELVKPEKVFASALGVKALKRHFGADLEIHQAEDGGTLSLGDRELHFTETRMLHWPDSMWSYLTPDKLLFSQDAFGMHLASSERFADELDGAVLEQEAAKYYANIILPYSALVTRLLGKVRTSGLELNIIAPDHGPIWREDIGRMPDLYGKWAAQEPTKKCVITYDTMWHSTERMATAIAEGAAAGGADVKVLPLGERHRSDVITELLSAGALVVGSPTMNNQMFPTVADFLVYAKGLKPRNLIGAAFGSYGWSGTGARLVARQLEEMHVELIDDVLECNYVPTGDELARCRELGRKIAERLDEKCGKGATS